MDKDRWQRIQALFESALDLPDHAREAFLRRACGDDDALYRDVGSLLAADSRHETLLPQLGVVARDAALSEADTGRQIGPYRVLGMLGSGGMGVVYKALDERLDRRVALKMLPFALNDDSWARERFIAEARAASSLDHPNICTIYAIDRTPDDQWYMAMGCYEGGTLAGRLARGALPLAEALQIAVQAARGLECAHRNGIYHRDVKPANLLFTTDGLLKIVDFGIAKIVGRGQTLTGMRLGTLDYMAPEQYRGETVDHRADVWALGMVLYEMLAGRLPGAAATAPDARPAPPMAPPAPLTAQRPDLPATVDRILGLALAPQPAQRYAGMVDLLADLEALAEVLGARLQPTDSVAAPGDRPRRAGGGAPLGGNADIRQATVLCVGLRGPGDGDLEAQLLRADWLQRTVATAVQQYGGTLVAQLDDEATAVFGAPVAHDNDQQRAVRCALQLRDAAREAGPGRLDLQVGIASGQVLASGVGVGQGDCKVTGGSLQAARQLRAQAGSGEILVSEEVKQAVYALCRCVPGPVLRDLARGVDLPLWSVAGFRQHTEADRQVMVGRDRQLRQFVEMLGDCHLEGRGQLVYVRGEAGIGKTRLVEAFRVQAVQQGFLAATGLVLDFGVPEGQDAIASVLRRLIEAAPRASIEREIEGADPTRRVFFNDLLGQRQPAALRTLAEAMEHGVRRRGQVEALGVLLRNAASRQPLLIVIEDVHWADRSLLELLAQMARETAEQPILLVVTSRIERDPLDAAWRATVRGTQLTTFDLAPLRTAEARAMAEAVSDAGGAYLEECVQRAAGNPLFLAQLLRTAAHGGGERVPPSLQSLVIARLDQLPAADKQALRAAAVIGQRFELGLLRFLLDDPIYRCDLLIEQGLLRVVGADYLFAHALILDAVYLSLPGGDRRLLHGRAADWFAGRDPGLAAEHLERAGDPGAAAAYRRAAEAQMLAYRYDRALQLVERAGALAQAAPERSGLHRLEGEIRENLGDIAGAQQCYETALQTATDDLARCRAWIGLAAGHDVADRPDAALQALAAAQQAVDAADHPLELARIHYLRGNLYFPRGDVDACRAEHELALRHARQAGCPEAEARALSGLGDAAYAQGRMGKAHGLFVRCLALCEAHGLGRVEAANRFMLGTVRIYQNETTQALTDSLAAAEAAARVGHVRAEIVSRLTAGWILFGMNRLDEAWDQAEQGTRLTQGLGARRFEPFLAETLARVELARGDRDAAWRRMQQAYRDGVATGGSFIGPWLAGTLALASPDRAARDRALEDGETLLAQGAVGHNHYRFYLAAMERTLADGDWDRAERYAAALAAYTAPEPTPWSDFFTAWTGALVRCGRGDRSESGLRDLAELQARAEAAGLAYYSLPLQRALAQLG